MIIRVDTFGKTDRPWARDPGTPAVRWPAEPPRRICRTPRMPAGEWCI